MKWPDSIFARMAWLLVIAIGLSQVGTFLAVRALGIGPAGEVVATAILAQVRLYETSGTSAQAPYYSPRVQPVAADPPRHQPPQLPFDRIVVENLARRLGAEADLRYGIEAGERRIWLRPAPTEDWLLVTDLPGMKRAFGILAAALAVTGIMVIFGAAWSARLLTRPIRRLARQAPALVLGEESVVPGGPQEVRVLGQTLIETGQRVAETARERELMLAGVSHDLRGPLTRMRLRLNLLEDAAAEDDIGDDLDEMERTIDGFIQYVRDGRDEPAEDVELADWIQARIEESADAGVRAGSLEPVTCRIKPLALKRAIRNLVENALAYGAPPVEISLRSSPEAVRIEVRDHGPGLAAAELQRALDPFEQFDRARSERRSGLGLAIVARIVKQHTGHFWLDSPAGGGLHAVIELPRSSAT